MQVVTFVPLPGTKPENYVNTLVGLHQYCRDAEPDFKAFKRYLRENDLFDKEGFEALNSFLGVKAVKGKPIETGKLLGKLVDADMVEDRSKILFHYLAKKNEILVKYVMDGLAERLYSTNELYRFITSYVYPGDYITLTNFKAWMDWLQASQHIKMIGIRWGLSPLGEEAMRYIKTIDVDEILEDEEDGGRGESDEDDEDDESSEVAVPTASAAEPVPQPEPTPQPVPTIKASPAPVPPPAPATPSAPATRPAGAVAAVSVGEPQVVVPTGTETVQVMVQPIAARSDEAHLQLVREAFEAADEEEDVDAFGEPTPALSNRLAQLRLDEDLVAENLRAVQTWWQSRPGGRLLSAKSYGFDAERFEAEPAFELFRLSCLAVSLFRHQGRLQVGKGGEAFGLLDQMGLFTNLYKSRKSTDTVLEALFKGGLGQRPELFSNLHYFLLFKRALKSLGDDGVKAMGASDEPEDVVGALWQHLGHFSLHYEVLWVARELFLLGAWPNARLAELGVVPLPRVRENAFRLGFIETPYAADFPSLVGVSRRLSSLFGKDDGFEAPLAYFEPARVLHYDGREPAFFTRDQLGID